MVAPNVALARTSLIGNYNRFRNLYELHARLFTDTMYYVDTSATPFPGDPPITYPDAEEWRELTERRVARYSQFDLAQSGPAEEKIAAALMEETRLEFTDTPLSEAIEFLEDAKTRYSGGWECTCFVGVQLQLPMTYAQLGRLEDAKAEIDHMAKYWTTANLAYYRTLIDHHKRDEDLEHRLHALRKAGLPEWPLGFEGHPEDRLDGEEVEALVFG